MRAGDVTGANVRLVEWLGCQPDRFHCSVFVAARVAVGGRVLIVGCPSALPLFRERFDVEVVEQCDELIGFDAFVRLTTQAAPGGGTPYRGRRLGDPAFGLAIPLHAAEEERLQWTYDLPAGNRVALSKPKTQDSEPFSLKRHPVAAAVAVACGVAVVLPWKWALIPFVVLGLPVSTGVLMGLTDLDEKDEPEEEVDETAKWNPHRDAARMLLGRDGALYIDASEKGGRLFAARRDALSAHRFIARDRDFAHLYVLSITAGDRTLRFGGYPQNFRWRSPVVNEQVEIHFWPHLEDFRRLHQFLIRHQLLEADER